MADQKGKGDQLLLEAQSKLKSSQGFMAKLMGGNSKTEEAAELYDRAGNSYKMAKEWRAAGDAYCSAASLHMRLQSKHEAATHYINAATAYKKSDPTEAVTCYLNAIEIYTDMGRFTTAAKHHMSIAELYENEALDLEKAMTHYEKAADYFKGEESNSAANKCMLKCAQYCAQLEQYSKAIQLYEEVATTCMENTLLKYSVKDYFFRACLCYMCMDLVEAQNVVQKYENMFPAFSDARECRLIKTLLQSCEDQNVEAFTEAVQEYDSISRLETWFTTMLLRVKKSLSEEPDLR